VDDALPRSHARTEQNHKKRTLDVLPKPDKLVRYRHILAAFQRLAGQERQRQ